MLANIYSNRKTKIYTNPPALSNPAEGEDRKLYERRRERHLEDTPICKISSQLKSSKSIIYRRIMVKRLRNEQEIKEVKEV